MAVICHVCPINRKPVWISTRVDYRLYLILMFLVQDKQVKTWQAEQTDKLDTAITSLLQEIGAWFIAGNNTEVRHRIKQTNSVCYHMTVSWLEVCTVSKRVYRQLLTLYQLPVSTSVNTWRIYDTKLGFFFIWKQILEKYTGVIFSEITTLGDHSDVILEMR